MNILTFPFKIIGYFLKVIIGSVRLLILSLIYRSAKNPIKSKYKKIQNKTRTIGLVEFPRIDLPSHVKGGDSSVHDDLIKCLKSAGYTITKIPYDKNFPTKNYFLKFLVGMPYIYSQIIKSQSSNYDLFISDSRTVWDLRTIKCISLFHDSYDGYLEMVGTGMNPLGNINSRVNAFIQRIGTGNTYNIAVSDFLLGVLKNHGIHIDQVIHNGIDISLYSTRSRSKLKNKKILYLGGYAYMGKGFDIIKRLGGMGNQIDCITNHSHGNWRNVRFLPQVSHLETRNIYKDYQLTIYPSRFESCQMVPLESMACGTPVLISNVGIGPDLAKDLPEFVVDGYGQKAIKEYDSKVKKILDNQAYFSSLAREYVVKNYDIDSFNQEWLKTIRSFYENTI